LGNVSLYKLLEWSVNNNYAVMDMAQGYLEYKRRWSNLIYEFDHHIIYSKKSALNRISAQFEIQKLHFKNFLKSKDIDVLLEKYKKGLRKNSVYQEEVAYQLEENDVADIILLKIINEEDLVFNLLRKPINDFLYTHKEHRNNLKVFEIIKDKEYLFQAKQIAKKLNMR